MGRFRFMATRVLLVLALLLTGWGIRLLAQDPGRFEERFVPVAEELASIYSPSYDVMDHVLKANAGYDHPGIAESDWRGLPPLYKLETAYLAAERAEKGGGGKMLALLSRSLSEDYRWMKTDAQFRPVIESLPKETASVPFASVSISDAKNQRPALTAEAKSVAAEITNLCTSGSEARRVLIEHFEMSPQRARDLVNERGLKDAFERAFQEIGDASQLDQRMRRFVESVDDENVGVRKNTKFDPWRGKEVAGNSKKPPLGGSGGTERTWASKNSGFRDSGFRYFEAGPNRAIELSNGPVAEVGSGEMQKKSAERFNQRIESGYQSKTIPSFKDAVKKPGGLGGIILGNSVEDRTGVKPTAVRWEKEAESGRLVVEVDGGELTYAPVSRENAVIAHRFLFAEGGQHTGSDDDPAIGLLGAEVHQWIEAQEVRVGARRSVFCKAQLVPLTVHPAVADLQMARDLAFADTFPASLRDPFEESVAQYRLIQAFSRLANDDPNELEASIEQPISETNGWKISDVEKAVAVQDGRLTVFPIGDFAQKPSKRLPVSLLTMYTFMPGGTPRNGFETQGGLRLLPYLIATQESYRKVNELAGVLAVSRWARSRGAKMEAILPERTFEPIAAMVMRSDRVEFLSRDEPSFDVDAVLSSKAQYATLLPLLGRGEKCVSLKRAIRERRFAQKQHANLSTE